MWIATRSSPAESARDTGTVMDISVTSEVEFGRSAGVASVWCTGVATALSLFDECGAVEEGNAIGAGLGAGLPVAVIEVAWRTGSVCALRCSTRSGFGFCSDELPLDSDESAVPIAFLA